MELWLKGQFGQLCPATTRCRTRTSFGSDSKVEFGSGPVNFGMKVPKILSGMMRSKKAMVGETRREIEDGFSEV
ncbi:unnamed protein product [Prunus armeniaca]